MECFQIAIDGPAASGKSSVARLAAQRLGGFYVNTGDMFRTVAWQTLEAGIDPLAAPEQVSRRLQEMDLRYICLADGKTLELRLNGQPVPMDKIRSPEAARRASQVATLPAVRTWLVERQRECRSLGIVIMEGRDIGTVVFPEARYKFFITASPAVRAHRRLVQGEVPPGATVEEVAAQIAERDRMDENRAVAPLRPAADAVTIVTDGMTLEAVVEAVLARIATCATAVDLKS